MCYRKKFDIFGEKCFLAKSWMRRFYAFMCLQNTKRPTTCFSTVIYSRDHQNMSYKHYCCICTELHPADHHPLNDLFPQRVKADQNPAGLTGRTNKNLHHRHRVSVLQQPGGTSCCHSCYVALGYYISTFFFLPLLLFKC